ncbi:MAG TPA: DUF58 domain-containing protein, partial [Saprospiraceae bacterium]|nr:DUF58 domain-containing protein [Saprospiraceae bacterium]
MKNLYLNNRFFILFGIVISIFVLSFPFGFLFPVALTVLVLAVILVCADLLIVFNRNVKIRVRRRLPKVLSLGDSNKINIELYNLSSIKLALTIIDEIPIQFQLRDFEQKLNLKPEEEKFITYELKPTERGEYIFGAINIFISSILGLVQKRYRHDYEMTVPVYPSIIQMKQFELRAFDRSSQQKGIKKLRRLGHSYEFEQIKTYVPGDDYRSINWKASSRRAVLMVNQFQDERSQQVYSIIDKSRTMKMPFDGLSLMDYAINSSLVISNIVLQKHDKAGLLSFSDKIGTTLPADRSPKQLNKILTALYNEKERPLEANYEILFHAARKLINGRSLLLLYTNFESMYALERVLPILRRINNLHLLVVIFFANTEIEDFTKQTCTNTEEIYYQTVAQKFINEKTQMVQKLKQYGIQAILTRPEDLSINT